MPRVNPEILTWTRQTAGLTVEDAARKLDFKDTRSGTGVQRLEAYETGQGVPTRATLVKMSKAYRRPLLTFYMTAPPREGDRGEDFRNVADRQPNAQPLVDALVRDVRARQSMVRSILEDEEEAEPLPFVGSMQMEMGVGAVLAAMRRTIGVDLADFRAQASPEGAFALLRNGVEAAGVFVLLIGNLGSHHTAIDVEAFRGFAVADPIAPFVIINDQDAKSAWTFTLLHELCHLWLGTTGVSGLFSDAAIERFCDDVAGSFLLPANELTGAGITAHTTVDEASRLISRFAEERHLSRSMVAYRLQRAGILSNEAWRILVRRFRDQWRAGRDAQREQDRKKDSGPNYYVVRRHRLGSALLRFVSRNLSDGSLTPTKAGKVLGVKPRSVEPLLNGAALAISHAA
jgi:Zn-dependent peptidase ImmA (M78 family)